MSDTTTAPTPIIEAFDTTPADTLTHEAVQSVVAAAGLHAAGNELALTDAVAAANATAAPTGPLEELVNGLHRRLSSMEGFIGVVSPIVELTKTAIETEFPAAATILNRLSQVEQFVAGLVHALDQHFGGKVALPPPPQGV